MQEDSKAVIVTGSGRGICATVAGAFAKQGDKVLIADLVPERVEATVATLTDENLDAVGCVVDVSNEGSVEAMVQTALSRWGRIDVLVNGAGSVGKLSRPTHETPAEEWSGVLGSNLTGSFLCAKYVLPAMMKQRAGRIINIASNAGRTVSPVLGASYTVAKTGVIGLTRHLAIEYAKYNILVNTVAPGPAASDRIAEITPDPAVKQKLIDAIPLGRLAQPQDIAEAIMFLASSKANFITGAILDVNGGYVLAH